MKKIFNVLFMIAITLTSFAQPQWGHELLGLPEQLFEATENTQLNTRVQRMWTIEPTTTSTTRNGVTTKTTGHVVRWDTRARTTQGCTLYGLNLIHDYYHGGFKNMTTNDTAIVLTNAIQELYIVNKGSDFVIHLISHPATYQDLEGQKFFERSREFVDAAARRGLGISLEELESRGRLTFRGKYRDLNTHLCSFFPYAEIVGGQIINRTFINGKQWNTINQGSLIKPDGRNGFGYMFQWRFRNECPLSGTSTGDMQGMGNLGQCGDSGWFDKNNPLATSINYTFGSSYSFALSNVTFDNSKKKVVVLYLGETPITGKESSNQCRIDLDTGLVTTF